MSPNETKGDLQMRIKSLISAIMLAVLLAVSATTALATHVSHHVYRAWWPILFDDHGPDAVWHGVAPEGCDDWFSLWDSVPSSSVPNLGIQAWNPVTDFATIIHNGLDGFKDCVGTSCSIWLCSTDALGSDPWSLRLGKY
jgi:hypothetical protein